MPEIRAKPLEWNEEPLFPEQREKEWIDRRMGFHIGFDPTEPEGEQYTAAWGEGDPEQFATLDQAKAWCQSEVDSWIRANAIIVD